MRKYILVIGLVSLFQMGWCSTTSLIDLIQQKKVTLQAISKGGFQGEVLNVIIKNLTKETLVGEMPEGSMFQCEDNQAQNLITLIAVSFTLKPAQSQNLLAYTNCIEPNDYSPYKDSKFKLRADVDPQLKGLAKLANKKEYREAMQGFMWSIVRKQNTYTYSKADSISYWPIYNYLAGFAKVEKYKEPVPPKPKFLYAIRVNITQNIEKTGNYTLLCKDQSGKMIREYYNNKSIIGGIYSVTVGFNDMVEDTTMKVTFQLINANNEVVAKKVVKNFLMDEKPKVYLLKTILEYEVAKAITSATLKLYDPNGQLLHTLYKNKSLPEGARRSPYSFYHTFGTNATFKAKLFDGQDNLVQEILINSKNSEEIK